jgi:hypothetical protein
LDAVDDTTTTPHGAPIVINVLSNDSSIPAGLPLTVVGFTKNPTSGFVKINEDGTVTYTPKPSFCACVPGDTFDYKIVNDSIDGISDTATVTVNITCPTSSGR